MRMKKLATSVGCPAFINSHPQKDFRTEALWFFCGAVVQPLKSLNSEQFWCFLHCSIQLPGYSQDCRGCRTRHWPVTPRGSAPRPTLRKCCAGGEGLAPPGAPRQAIRSQGERACGLRSAADAVHSLPLPPGCSGPGLSGNELCGAERSTHRERGAPARASPSRFELGREEVDCGCYALAVI